MNLDDLAYFKQLDTHHVLERIDNLPDQLQQAWQSSKTQPLPKIDGFRSVVICGVGDSAMGAEFIAAYASKSAALPIVVHQDYGLPAFAKGKDVLVVCVSRSGNAEETLDAFETALKMGCSVLVISSGGALTQRAAEQQITAWQCDQEGHTVGMLFGLLLGLFARLGLIADPAAEVIEAVAAMKRSQENLQANVVAASNPAKRYAGQLVGRWVTVFGAGAFAPVARRWKHQINTFAKAGANAETLPEANQAAVLATLNPQQVLNSHTMTMFLRASSDHPRNRTRSDLTRQAFMLEGLNTDFVDARGESLLAQMCTLTLFGDYMAYYLAMAYGVNPDATEALDGFQAMLGRG